jgi:putative ABC transport system substrate-binding protein
LKRRDFITLLGGATAWPLAARARQPAKQPLIGMLVPGTRATHGQWFAALVDRLRELGWIEGRTVAFEYRFAEGRTDRAAEIVAEFVRMKVDLIATAAADVTLAAKQVTSAIPIVALMSDPIGTGLIASFNRPGGNVTGISVQQDELAGKRVELLRAKSCLVFVGLRSLPTLETRHRSSNWSKPTRRREASVSTQSKSKSAERTTLLLALSR